MCAASSSQRRFLHIDKERFALRELDGLMISYYAGTSLGCFMSKAKYNAQKRATRKWRSKSSFPSGFIFVHFTYTELADKSGKKSKNKVKISARGEAIMVFNDPDYHRYYPEYPDDMYGKVCAVLLKPTEHTFKGTVNYGRLIKRMLNPNSHFIVDKYKDNEQFERWLQVLEWNTDSAARLPFAEINPKKMKESEILKSWKLDIRMMYEELGESALDVTTFRCTLFSGFSCVFTAFIIEDNGEVIDCRTVLTPKALYYLLQ